MNPIDIFGIAKAQKGILWCVLANIIIYALAFFVSQAFNLLILVLIIVEIYFVYKLLKALGSKYWILWIIGMIIPGLSLILLLVLNSNATKAIKSQGYKVGLMGARLADIKVKAS